MGVLPSWLWGGRQQTSSPPPLHDPTALRRSRTFPQSGITFLFDVPLSSRRVQGLVIGLGGGALPTFLTNHFDVWDLTTVELDPVIVDLAQQYFGFVPREHNRVVVGDGIQFVNDYRVGAAAASSSTAPSAATAEDSGSAGSPSGSATTVTVGAGTGAGAGASASEASGGNEPFHAVIVDVDAKDLSTGMSFPPKVSPRCSWAWARWSVFVWLCQLTVDG